MKPAAWMCAKCGGTPGEWHFEHATDVTLLPLFTRDDLVRAWKRGYAEAGQSDDEPYPNGASDHVDEMLREGEG